MTQAYPPDSPTPYTRSDVARMTGASPPQVKKLATGLLKKKAPGTGNYLGFTFDDALRIAVARELLSVGVQLPSIKSLFAALDAPHAARGKTWPWLKTAEARYTGAALVLLLAHPLLPDATGAVYLTTARDAVDQLAQRPARTVIVIDVNALIGQLEQHSGQAYSSAGVDAPTLPM